jgi:hypothetical protein
MSGFILSTEEPTKSLGIKTEYTPIIVLSDWLICLAYDWRVKDE